LGTPPITAIPAESRENTGDSAGGKKDKLEICQFPDVVVSNQGYDLMKLSKWK